MAKEDYRRYGAGWDRDDYDEEARASDQSESDWGAARGDYGGYATGDFNREYGEDQSYGGGYLDAESHAGRGPRGWRRPDERILEDVCDLMTQDPDLDASDISVGVSDGEVILEGTVEGRWAKHLAEDLADSVPGVRDVQNRLRLSDVINRCPDSPLPM